MRRLQLSTASLLILGGAFGIAYAATTPPAISFSAQLHKATLHTAPAGELTMGRLRIQLEKTSLHDVLAAASAGAIEHQGDAGASTYWICYTNVNSTFAERIWIVSDAEMGGEGRLVTGVSAQRLNGGEASADCPALPAALRPVALEHGVWLDTPPPAVRQKLGNASFRSGNMESFEYEGKVPGRCEGGGFDRTNSLLLRIEKGRIDFLRLAQVTSC